MQPEEPPAAFASHSPTRQPPNLPPPLLAANSPSRLSRGDSLKALADIRGEDAK